MDTSSYGQGNASYGISQGAQGVPNGPIGAMLGGTQSGGLQGSQSPQQGVALDPGTHAALQAILPVLMKQQQQKSAAPQSGAAKTGAQPAKGQQTASVSAHPTAPQASQAKTGAA